MQQGIVRKILCALFVGAISVMLWGCSQQASHKTSDNRSGQSSVINNHQNQNELQGGELKYKPPTYVERYPIERPAWVPKPNKEDGNVSKGQ